MMSASNLPSAALLVGIAFLCPDLSAQAAPEDAGIYQVGWYAADFWDNFHGRGHVRGRIYYPAASTGENAWPDVAGGPYPLVALNHGWFGTPDNYHHLSQHLASWGFIVSSIGTETGFFGNMVREAADSRALMAWVVNESNTPSSRFYTMVNSKKLGVIGHSMGGGSLTYMMGLEPRIQTYVPMEGYINGLGFDSQGLDNMRAFTGSILVLAGSLDDDAPPLENAKRMYDQCILAKRRHIVMLEGAGHGGCTDNPPTNEPMSQSEQQRLHRRYVGAFLRAELYGEEELYGEMFGFGADLEPVAHKGEATAPSFWATPEVVSPNTISVGMTGLPGENSLMVWSLTPANLSTSYGTLGLDPRTASVLASSKIATDGTLEILEPIPTQWSLQTVYFQAITSQENDARLTRSIKVDMP
ncbi:MAG: dienelactone hydrolase family protein [Planctomycetota bacterium]|jgi:dienelactone hydrolase|nr:dienelactone hydrolase family protein [Planctomycetota bacterium]